MGGAAVGVIASTAVVTRLQSQRLNAGAVLLHNALVAKGDPTSLSREEVVDIGNRYSMPGTPDARCQAASGCFHPYRPTMTHHEQLSQEQQQLHPAKEVDKVVSALMD